MEGAHKATANQISITKSERGNTEVVRDDVGGYSKIQPGEFPAGPAPRIGLFATSFSRTNWAPQPRCPIGRCSNGVRNPRLTRRLPYPQLQFEIRENEPI